MAKIEKRFLSFGLVLALMVALSSVCFAEEFNFSNLKKSVDSNSWSYIGSATKDSATENGELKSPKCMTLMGMRRACTPRCTQKQPAAELPRL